MHGGTPCWVAHNDGRYAVSTVGVLTRWHARGTLTNPEQLLLLVGFPIAALAALTYTPLGSGFLGLPGLLVLALMGAAFASPAITWAFEREQGTWALIASAPVSRMQWWWSLLFSVLINVAISCGALILGSLVMARPMESAITVDAVAVALGVVLVTAVAVSWASALAGRLRATAVLALANLIFVVAVLFGGILIPAADVPWGAVIAWLPTGAAVSYFTAALTGQSIDGGALAVLAAWLIPGVLLGTRMWRWR